MKWIQHLGLDVVKLRDRFSDRLIHIIGVVDL